MLPAFCFPQALLAGGVSMQVSPNFVRFEAGLAVIRFQFLSTQPNGIADICDLLRQMPLSVTYVRPV